MMLNLAASFLKSGYAVDLVLARAQGEYMEQIPEGARLVELDASKPLTAVPGLAQYLRTRQPHALLSTMTHVNLAALWAARLSRTGVRCVVREAEHLSSRLAMCALRHRWTMPRLVRQEYARADAVVATSQGVAQDLYRVGRLPRERIQVVYNPVIDSTFRKRCATPAIHPWFDDSLPIILGVGRLTAQKDFTTLLKAFALVKRGRPARLMILGEGEERPRLERLAQELGVAADVDMPGFVDNPYPYMARAAAFVLSSRWEGLPNVLIEALACGTRVISTDCPSGPAEILDRGRYGQLVPVGEPEAMARAMERVLSGNFQAADPTHHLNQFDANRVAAQYLQLLCKDA